MPNLADNNCDRLYSNTLYISSVAAIIKYVLFFLVRSFHSVLLRNGTRTSVPVSTTRSSCWRKWLGLKYGWRLSIRQWRKSGQTWRRKYRHWEVFIFSKMLWMQNLSNCNIISTVLFFWSNIMWTNERTRVLLQPKVNIDKRLVRKWSD